MEEEQVIQILGALEDIRANYKRRCSQLSRQMQSLALLHTIGQKEEMYVALYRMMQEVTRLVQTWETSLPVDELGDVIYPEQNQPGFAFTPDQIFIWDLQDKLKSIRKEFVRYKHDHNTEDQAWVEEHTQLEFLKGGKIEKAILIQVHSEENLNDTVINNNVITGNVAENDNDRVEQEAEIPEAVVHPELVIPEDLGAAGTVNI